MSDDLVKRLRYCAPERRDCSRNELAMLDAADRIEQLEAELVLAKCDWARQDNWCGRIGCHCQIARKALEGESDESFR